jgi:membrane-bound metal-dependent hydrolase YbcI (DUF457 family)
MVSMGFQPLWPFSSKRWTRRSLRACEYQMSVLVYTSNASLDIVHTYIVAVSRPMQLT